MKTLNQLTKKELIEYIQEIRPKADAYDRVCQQLGIKHNILAYIKKLKMKSFIILLLLSFTAQAQLDSTKSAWYARVMPVSLYTGYGIMTDRITQNIEVGRSFGVMDFGISYGRISLRPDSTQFVEGKITMNVAQYGRFSNEMVVGGGYVFNSKTPIMLELSYTIYAQIYKKVSLGVVTGYYNLSGETQSIDKNYFGLALRYGLQRDDNGGLLNTRMRPRIKTKHHRIR